MIIYAIFLHCSQPPVRCMQGDINNCKDVRADEVFFLSSLVASSHRSDVGKKWRVKPWERVSFCLCVAVGWKVSQLMNLTPSVKKDKIFLCVIEFFCCRMMHDYFTFLKREGVQTHKARLTASHTVNDPTYKLMFDCMIFGILFALLFHFFTRRICDVRRYRIFSLPMLIK